jgi:L-threonylcarbamoyladenylate synthase
LPPTGIMNTPDMKMVEEAARIIRSGGIVAFPTETVYGLGADAENPIAVARSFEVKARPRIDPLIVHVADRSMAMRYGLFPASSHRLMDIFWPGPLTLVVPKKPSVQPIVTAGLETVAIRIPAHPVALALIQSSGCGIAAPSANPFGYVSPTEAKHVSEQLSGKVDRILDGGPCIIGLESTILSLTGDVPCILRVGGTSIEELKSVLDYLEIQSSITDRPQAPGQMAKHYATRTSLEIIEEGLETIYPAEKTGLLSFRSPAYPFKYSAVEILSASGNIREAAAKLFGSLRRLDNLGLNRIIARPVPEEGLGIAIMDRLRRCSDRRDSEY